MVVYRPPSGSCQEFLDKLTSFIEQGLLTNSELYICGDFNIDFLQRNNPKTKSLITFLRSHGLEQHIKTATRLTGFSRTCIDYIITNIPDACITASGILCEVISDHFPVFICVKKRRNRVEYCKIKGRTYKNYDKIMIQTLLQHDDWNNYYNLSQPEDLWNIIYENILKHLNIMCPIKFIRIRKNSPPWITHEIVELINDRNALFKLAHNDPNEINMRNARMQRNRVNKLITTSKSTYIKDTLSNNRDNPKKFWRILNQTLLRIDNGGLALISHRFTFLLIA